VAEIARSDPPVHNTRRWVTRDGAIAGEAVAAGEEILVILAAPEPPLGFGHGPHACPGAELAVAVATAAVDEVRERGIDLAPLRGAVRYRALPNVRVLESF
jgi:cytochrome P450